MWINKSLIALALLGTTAAAQAATCEEGFEVVGDARNGQVFSASVKVPGLKIESALGQLRKLAMDEQMTVGADEVKGNQGQMYFMQTTTRTPVVTLAGADSAGNVTLVTKLARGQTMDREGGKQALCGMLNAVKAGKEGERIAAEARAGLDTPIQTTAVELSKTVGKEMERLGRQMNAGSFKDLLIGTTTSPDALRDREAMFRPMMVKYAGRRYTIDGQVYTASLNQFSGVFQVGYLVTQTGGLLRVRQNDSKNNMNFTISCDLAKDQGKLAATLNSHDWVKLTGIVETIELNQMKLRDCRQAN